MTERWPLGRKEMHPTHGKQAHYHRALIANPVNDLRRRYGENKICSKEGKLNQHDLRVIQVENRLQVGDKNVIEAGEESPHEKQRSHYRQRRPVRGRMSQAR